MVYLYIIESDISYYIETSRENIWRYIKYQNKLYWGRCNEMSYEEIYKGLTEEKEKSRKDLLRLIKNLEKNSVALNWYIHNRAQWEKWKYHLY